MKEPSRLGAPGVRGGRHARWALLFALSGCYATAAYDVPGDADSYDDVPPPGFIVSAPVYYFDGRPTYWYRGQWHYRDGDHWRRYRSEPAPLRDYRAGQGRQVPMAGGRPAPVGRAQPGVVHGGGRPSPRVYERPRRLHR